MVPLWRWVISTGFSCLEAGKILLFIYDGICIGRGQMQKCTWTGGGWTLLHWLWSCNWIILEVSPKPVLLPLGFLVRFSSFNITMMTVFATLDCCMTTLSTKIAEINCLHWFSSASLFDQISFQLSEHQPQWREHARTTPCGKCWY